MADSATKDNSNHHLDSHDLHPHLEVHSVDGPGLPDDVSATGAGVCEEHMSKLLTTLSNNNNPRF